MMIAKVTFLCVVFAAAVRATGDLHGIAVVNTGISSNSRHQDKLGNYAFSYDILDAKGASNSRSEVGDSHGNKKGSYTLHGIDGRARRVDYIADGHGFRAVVKTNEPGTAFSAPASVIIDSPYVGPIAPIAASPVGKTAIAPGAVAHTAPAAPVVVPPLIHHSAANPVTLSGYNTLLSPWVSLENSIHGIRILPHHDFGFKTLDYGSGAINEPGLSVGNLAYVYGRSRHPGLDFGNLASGKGIFTHSALGLRNLAYGHGFIKNSRLGHGHGISELGIIESIY